MAWTQNGYQWTYGTGVGSAGMTAPSGGYGIGVHYGAQPPELSAYDRLLGRQANMEWKPDSSFDRYMQDQANKRGNDPWAAVKEAADAHRASFAPKNPAATGRPGTLGRVSAQNVELTPEEQSAVALVNSLMTGQYGRFKQLLSGTPDMGLLEQAVLGPSRRNLQEVIIPGIEQQFSGGPYGGSYNTGARRETVARAYSDEATRRAQAMQAETAMARQLGLEAARTIPALTQVAGLGRQAEESNANRQMQASLANMEARFKEAGLSQQAANQALETARLALQKAGMEWQQKTEEQKIGNEMAQFAAQLDLKNRELEGNLGIAQTRNAIAWNEQVAKERQYQEALAASRLEGETKLQQENDARARLAQGYGSVLNLASNLSRSDFGLKPADAMLNFITQASSALGSVGFSDIAMNMLYGGVLQKYVMEQEAARQAAAGAAAPKETVPQVKV